MLSPTGSAVSLTLPGSFQVFTMLALTAPDEAADAAALNDDAATEEAAPDELLAAGALAEPQAGDHAPLKIINAITGPRACRAGYRVCLLLSS